MSSLMVKKMETAYWVIVAFSIAISFWREKIWQRSLLIILISLIWPLFIILELAWNIVEKCAQLKEKWL